MNDQTPFVSLIVPMRNEAAHIRRCLDSILSQDYPLACLEVLVIDGQSTDNAGMIVADYAAKYPHLRLLQNPKKIIPAAWNIGIRHAQGQIVGMVNAHSMLAPDYVKECVAALRRSGAAGVGGVMHPVGQGYVSQAIALALGHPFSAGDARYRYSRQEAFVDTVPLGVYWRKIFERAGFFDEAMVRNEDFEFNYRVRQSGGKLFLSPAIRFYYIPRSSLRALWRQYFQNGRWKVVTVQKHPASLRWRQTIPPLFVGLLFGSLLLTVFWPIVFWLFIFGLGCYLLTNLVVSIILSAQNGWRYWPILPLVFAVIHFAWGLGFWYGVVTIPIRFRLDNAIQNR
ncbi:MAG: glycosyltransferase family 2 protein [Anaerolineae bacterium]|nr:glycosyltransferase family 2 protein [Anaerolineae bacterium]